MRSHERRVGTYTQDIWKDENGKKKQKLVRDKPNEDKVCIERITMKGFKMEFFYYKNDPDTVWLGVGDKVTTIDRYEIKKIKSAIMKVSNKMGLMGYYAPENLKKLVKKTKEAQTVTIEEQTDPFRVQMRKILSKK